MTPLLEFERVSVRYAVPGAVAGKRRRTLDALLDVCRKVQGVFDPEAHRQV